MQRHRSRPRLQPAVCCLACSGLVHRQPRACASFRAKITVPNDSTSVPLRSLHKSLIPLKSAFHTPNAFSTICVRSTLRRVNTVSTAAGTWHFPAPRLHTLKPEVSKRTARRASLTFLALCGHACFVSCTVSYAMIHKHILSPLYSLTCLTSQESANRYWQFQPFPPD